MTTHMTPEEFVAHLNDAARGETVHVLVYSSSAGCGGMLDQEFRSRVVDLLAGYTTFAAGHSFHAPREFAGDWVFVGTVTGPAENLPPVAAEPSAFQGIEYYAREINETTAHLYIHNRPAFASVGMYIAHLSMDADERWTGQYKLGSGEIIKNASWKNRRVLIQLILEQFSAGRLVELDEYVTHVRGLGTFPHASGECEPGEGTQVVLAERWAKLDDWQVLTEVCDEPFDYPGKAGKPRDPQVRVLQHRQTREIRVDVYDCTGGLDVTYTNGGVADEDKKRHQRWFRDVQTCRDGLRALRVRFMARGEASNLRLES